MEITRSSILFLLAITTAGCNLPNADTYEKDMKRIGERHRSEQDKIMEQFKIDWERGGQPGKIQIEGIVVSDQGQLESRIVLESTTGIGKNGKRAPLAEESKPVLTSQLKESDRMEELTQRKNLIGMGCPKEELELLASHRGLTIEPQSELAEGSPLILVGKVIVLCGPLSDSKISLFSFSSDELILKGLTLSHFGLLGSISVTTNHLHLVGLNRIVSSGFLGLSNVAAPITMRVHKSITSDSTGALKIESIGRSYEEPK